MKDSTNTIEYDRIIRPKRGLIGIDFAELWAYRELFLFFGWRHITIRYKQTLLGILWSVIKPLLTMIVFTFVFGQLAGFNKDSAIPYAMITLSGVVIWEFFSSAMSNSGQSLVSQSNLITKVYFPRLVIPSTYIISSTFDLLITIILLFIMMGIYKIVPTARILMLPLFYLVAASTAFGAGLWLSALNIKYRDVTHIIPFLIRIGIYICPVGFLSTKISPRYRFWYSLNPVVGAIDGFRWCILGPDFAPYWPGFFASIVVIVILLISGAFYFRYVEKTFADLI